MKSFKQFIIEQKLQRHEYIAKLANQHANLSMDHDQFNPHFHSERWNSETQKQEPFDKEDATRYARHRTIGDIADFDPDKKSNSNTQWMIRQYSKGHYKHEDLPRVSSQIDYFHKIKHRLPKTERDINQYTLNPQKEPKKKSLVQAINSQKEYDKEYPEGEHFSHPQAKEVPGDYDRSKLKVFHLTTHAAAKGFRDSCKHEDNTGGWCTGWNSSENFNNYHAKGPIYGIELKQQHPDGHHEWKKYQFHFPTESFMDKDDRYVNTYDLTENHPELKKVRWNFNDSEGTPAKAETISPFLSDRAIKLNIEHAAETGNHKDFEHYLTHHPEHINSSHIHSLLDSYEHNKNIDPSFITKRVFRHPATTQEHINRFWDMHKDEWKSYYTTPNIFRRHAEDSFGDMVQHTKNPEHLKWFYNHSRDVRAYGNKHIAGVRLHNEYGIIPHDEKIKTKQDHLLKAEDHDYWADESAHVPSLRTRQTFTNFHKMMSDYHRKKSEE